MYAFIPSLGDFLKIDPIILKGDLRELLSTFHLYSCRFLPTLWQ